MLSLMNALALGLAPASIPPQSEPQAAPPTTPKSAELAVDVDEARTRLGKAVRWLLAEQRSDGAWGSGAIDSVQFTGFSVETYYVFQYAANSLAFMALCSIDASEERDRAAAKALTWLLDSRLPKRGNDWDVDCTWAALYGFQAMVAASSDPRFQTEALWERVNQRGADLYALLEHNQEPLGGWGYYEGPVVSNRPTWSTSFATSCVIPALVRARGMGWKIDPAVIERAVRYVERCRTPAGAYMYDLRPLPRSGGESIDDVKGSLGRIQVSNWALRRAGVASVTDERLREGLEAFFEHHKFLDVARMRPIPHEAYYANAAYFYMFAHCYAAQAINELPEPERAAWHRRLRAHLAKIQWEDGSSLDFPNMSCMQTAGTAFSILAFQAGIPGSKASL
jgi:hypothetical protein